MTLYLKYRPQKLDELDLGHVREQLKKIVSSKSLPHAFLFSGPKGAGKTSAARILAKIVNCKHLGKDHEPCNKCESCIEIEKGRSLDVVEIDAASNRGIDDIRALKENIMLAPSSASKKVYIVDEAHMLTTEAANAFLKTLEEPPDHAIFILATTDPQKLPETVRSRLVNVNFRRASGAEIARQIKRVSAGEKVKITDGAVGLIAKAADGSFRDAVKIFEQLVTMQGNSIDESSVESLVMSGTVFDAKDFLQLIKEKDSIKILEKIKELSVQGVSMKNLIESLIDETRELILEPQMVRLIELLIEAKSRMKDSGIAELPLEIAVVKFCGIATSSSEEDSTQKKEQNPDTKIVQESKSAASKDEEVEETKSEVKGRDISTFNEKSATQVDEQMWKQIMIDAKNRNTSVEALLRAAEPIGFDGSHLKLGVYYKFHKERLEVSQNKIILEEVVSKVLGGKVNVSYELTERKFTPPPDKPLTTANDKDIISAAKEIFGN